MLWIKPNNNERTERGELVFDELDTRWRCCCQSIHVLDGAKMIGWFRLTGLIVGTAFMTFNYLNAGHINEAVHERYAAANQSEAFIEPEQHDNWHTMQAIQGQYMQMTLNRFIGSWFVFLSFLTCTVLMLAGLYNEKRHLMLPYLVVEFMAALMQLFTVIGFLISLWLWYVVLQAFRYMSTKSDHLEQMALNSSIVPSGSSGAAPRMADSNTQYEAPPSYESATAPLPKTRDSAN